MNQQNNPQLQLGRPPKEMRTSGARSVKVWHALLFLLQGAVLVCLLFLLAQPANRQATVPPEAMADDLREAATQLEEKSLWEEAAKAWRAYLQVAPQATDRAEILYRMGKLFMQAEQYSDAVTALVRADVAARDDANLQSKIGQQLVECLRQMGHYGEVERELSRRVEAGGEQTGRGEVLARMAGDDLTEADLDLMIQRLVDRTIAAQGVTLDPAARESMLKRFSDPRMRQQMLQQLLQTELFCRRARESDMELDQQPDFQQAVQFMADNLLANRFLAKQLETIQPTNVDIDAYYQANQDRYRKPESLQLQWIQLKDGETAESLLGQIQSAEDFRRLVLERRGQDGELPPPAVVEKGRPASLFEDVELLFQLNEEQWTQQAVAGRDGNYLVLVEKKIAASLPPLDEIRRQVENDYTRIKQQELVEKLFRELMTRYDVELTSAAEQPSANDAAAETTPDAGAETQEDAN
jgi:tetratricopeptide (TPR) repeat protein